LVVAEPTDDAANTAKDDAVNIPTDEATYESADVTVRDATDEAALSSPHRLFALADGVFAISMTLLALDVRIDNGVPETTAGFRSAAADFYGQFGVFFAAFMIASRFWLSNHRIMSHLDSVDNGVLQRTVLFLAGISSLPVATAVLFRFGSVPEAVAFAGGLLALTTLLSGRLWWYLSNPKRRLSRVDPATRLPFLVRLLVNVAIFLLAIPVAFLLPHVGRQSNVSYALLIWLLLPFDGVFAGFCMRVLGWAR
jgi:uncharacterized membrane protein